MSVLQSLGYILRLTRRSKQCALQFEVFRGLYSATALGIDGFTEQQKRTNNQLHNIREKFRVKMQENVKENSPAVIFTEDLKNMVHIAKEDDVNVVIKMMKKFNQQNKELRFGNFVFGPVVMRMFYILNKPDEALKSFKSPELAGFFDQLSTYQILCDLLYENKRYEDVLECFDIIKNRQLEGLKYPKNIVVLVYASYYKQNTAESVENAMKLWSELFKVGHIPVRRTATFFAGLLLKQNKPEIALEVISNIKNQNYATVRNLKVQALTTLNRLEDTIPVLKAILQQETVQTFNKDTLEMLSESLEKANNPELLSEFNHLMKIFKDQDHICEATLEEQLTSEITGSRFHKQQTTGFQNNRVWRPRHGFQRTERLALGEME